MSAAGERAAQRVERRERGVGLCSVRGRDTEYQRLDDEHGCAVTREQAG